MTLEELRAALKAMNIAQLQVLADKCGLNMHTLFRIGQGKTKPHASTVRRILEVVQSNTTT